MTEDDVSSHVIDPFLISPGVSLSPIALNRAIPTLGVHFGPCISKTTMDRAPTQEFPPRQISHVDRNRSQSWSFLHLHVRSIIRQYRAVGSFNFFRHQEQSTVKVTRHTGKLEVNFPRYLRCLCTFSNNVRHHERDAQSRPRPRWNPLQQQPGHVGHSSTSSRNSADWELCWHQ